MYMSLSKLQEIMKDRGNWCAAIHGVEESHGLATEQQQKHVLAVVTVLQWTLGCMYLLIMFSL